MNSIDFFYITLITSITVTIFSSVLTSYLFIFAKKCDITDRPESAPQRKRQKKPIPLLGGTGFGIVCLVISALVWYIVYSQYYTSFGLFFLNNIENGINFVWIVIAGFILLIGGFLDDKFNLPTKYMFLPINLALITAVWLGNLKIEAFSYPFDKILPDLVFFHHFLAWIWIGLCLAATKFLDGHDGLVSNVGIISFISIAVVASFGHVDQPLIVLLSLIWVAGIIGFLPFNLPNAKMYLGEGGSELIGFMIGVLSILSGAKTATASGVVGWFIFDLFLVMWIRKKSGKSIVQGGREHWHFRLADLGYGKWQVLLITNFIILISAVLGIFLPTIYKPFVLISQFLLIIFVYNFTNKKTCSLI